VIDYFLATPIGGLGGCFENNHLVATQWINSRSMRAPHSRLVSKVFKQIQAYFISPTPFSMPLLLKGTPFQQRVWQALQTIPIGQTMTYGQLAKKVGTHPRAIGGACRANPLPIVIPCHRVVGQAQLGGYVGNDPEKISIKQWLLQHEGVFL